MVLTHRTFLRRSAPRKHSPGERGLADCSTGVFVRPTSVAALRAGSPRRPPFGVLAAATDETSEGARCGRRAAMQLVPPVPTNGPHVSSSAKLGAHRPREHPRDSRRRSRPDQAGRRYYCRVAWPDASEILACGHKNREAFGTT